MALDMYGDQMIQEVKKCLFGKSGSRRRGRPRSKWLNDVLEDLNKVGVKDWKEKSSNWKTWKQVCEMV